MSGRREFLKNIGGLTCLSAFEHLVPPSLSSLVLGAQRALASGQTDPSARFVLFRVHGAMDSTLGLHPHLGSTQGIDPQDLFLGYEGENQPLEKMDGTQISLGPSARVIAPFAKEMAILRGIYVGPNDLGHPFAIQHMSSGRTQESAPHFSAYIGNQFAHTGAYVVTNSPLQTGHITSFPTLLTSVLREQLINMTYGKKSSTLSVYANSKENVTRFLDLQGQTEKLARFVEILGHQDGEFDQQEYDQQMSRGVPSDMARTRAKTKSLKDEDLAFASLYSGIARVVQIDLRTEEGQTLDTHVQHAETHLAAQCKRWERIAKFLGNLRQHDLLKQTLVVVVSEFNRTPGLNANGGKDHNYSDNAVALFGRGVNGGTVIGGRNLFKRSDGFPYAFWAGSFIDFDSGEVVPISKELWQSNGRVAAIPQNVNLIRPGDLWASVIQSLDPKMMRLAPDSSLGIPRIFHRS